MRLSVEEVEVGPLLVDLTTGRILRDGLVDFAQIPFARNWTRAPLNVFLLLAFVA